MVEILEIRPATEADVGAIGTVIVRAVSEVNSRDYPIDTIAEIVAGAGPEGVRARLAARTVLVAARRGEVLGTAGLEETSAGAALRSLYVRPDAHRQGIGAHLLGAIEALARARGHAYLHVPASLTAVAFYRACGYAVIGPPSASSHTTVPMGRML